MENGARSRIWVVEWGLVEHSVSPPGGEKKTCRQCSVVSLKLDDWKLKINLKVMRSCNLLNTSYDNPSDSSNVSSKVSELYIYTKLTPKML